MSDLEPGEKRHGDSCPICNDETRELIETVRGEAFAAGVTAMKELAALAICSHCDKPAELIYGEYHHNVEGRWIPCLAEKLFAMADPKPEKA